MEKFNLTWSEFVECRSNAISDLLLDKDFTDVTLVCEDNKQIATHKLIISSCSLFFKNIFKNNPHQNPLIYLKGVKFVHLQSMLKFIYLGQVEVEADDLEEFIATAKDLQVKGLAIEDEISAIQMEDKLPTETDTGETSDSDDDWVIDKTAEKDSFHEAKGNLVETEENIANTSPSLDKERYERKYPCDRCDYKTGHLSHLKRHISSRHEGITFPCEHCDYKATQITHLRRHKVSFHTISSFSL